MKKKFIYPIKKINFYLILSMSLFLLFINSCKKDQDQQNKVEDIVLLKNWFQANKSENPTNFIKGLTPDWENTYASTADGVLTLEVNLQKQSNIAFLQASSDDDQKETNASKTNIRLVLLKNISTGAIDGCYMVVTASSAEELGNLHYKTFSSLKGKVMYFDLQGAFVNGYTYAGGRITNKLSRGNPADVSDQLQLNSDVQKTSPSSGFNKKLMVVDVSSCNTQPVDVYVENCYTTTPGTISDPVYNPVSSSQGSGKIMSGGNQTCVWVYSETIYQTTCEYTDPSEPGSGSYGGSGGNDSNSDAQINAVKDVTNDLKDLCKNTALSKITDIKIKNFVTGFYNNFLIPKNSKINVTFKEGSNLKVNNNIVPAYSVDTSPHNWEINISSNYYSTTAGFNMSQEGWGIILAHEVIHIFIKENNLNNNNSSLDHVVMFKNFVNPTAKLLKESFGMSETDALKLALSGMKDLWGFSDFAALCNSTYNVTLNEIDANYDKYTKGTGGTKCN